MRAHIKLPVWQPFLLKPLTSPVLFLRQALVTISTPKHLTPQRSHMSYFHFFLLKRGAAAQDVSFAASAWGMVLSQQEMEAGRSCSLPAGGEAARRSHIHLAGAGAHCWIHLDGAFQVALSGLTMPITSPLPTLFCPIQAGNTN